MFPKFNPDAKFIRTIGPAKNGRMVFIMNDGTYRIFVNPKRASSLGEEIFATGLIGDKTDNLIILEAEELLNKTDIPLRRVKNCNCF